MMMVFKRVFMHYGFDSINGGTKYRKGRHC